jgi:hypothetical protein
VLFPTQEKPHLPGLLHIGYVLITNLTEAIVAYTTSQPWPSGVPLPAGVRFFDAAEAAQLNQSRSFLLRLDTLAKLPMTRIWFPDLDSAAKVIAVAPPRLQEELVAQATNLRRRQQHLIQMRGP